MSRRRGAVAVFGCFALDGPQRCSGLPAARYGPDELAGRLGGGWTLIARDRDEHITPAGAAQPFTRAAFRRGASGTRAWRAGRVLPPGR
jgi:hypothetical protein